MGTADPPTTAPRQDDDVIFVREFKHWRSGKIIRAADYGLKAFPIRVR